MKINIQKIVFNGHAMDLMGGKSLIITGDSGKAKTPFMYLILLSLGNKQVWANYLLQYSNKQKDNESITDVFSIRYSISFDGTKKTFDVNIRTNVSSKKEGKIHCKYKLKGEETINNGDIKTLEKFILQEMNIPRYIYYEGRKDHRGSFDFMPFYSLIQPNKLTKRSIFLYDTFEDGKFTKLKQSRFISAGLLRTNDIDTIDIIRKISDIKTSTSIKRRDTLFDEISQIIKNDVKESGFANEKIKDTEEDLINRISSLKASNKKNLLEAKDIAYIGTIMNNFEEYINSENSKEFLEETNKTKLLESLGVFLNSGKESVTKKAYLIHKIARNKKEIKELQHKLMAIEENGEKIVALKTIKKTINDIEWNKTSSKIDDVSLDQLVFNSEIIIRYKILWDNFYKDHIKDLVYSSSDEMSRRIYSIDVGNGGIHSNEYLSRILKFYHQDKSIEKEILLIDDLYDNYSEDKREANKDDTLNKTSLLKEVFKTNRQIFLTIKKDDLNSELQKEIENNETIIHVKFPIIKK